MPRYRFDGYFETVLHGLSHGVNAVLHRDGHGQPEGSTVVVQPGDEVTTKAAYPHAHMTDLDGKGGAKKAAPRKTAAKRAPRAKAEKEHPGFGEPMTAVEHPADGTMSPPISNDDPTDDGQE